MQGAPTGSHRPEGASASGTRDAARSSPTTASPTSPTGGTHGSRGSCRSAMLADSFERVRNGHGGAGGTVRCHDGECDREERTTDHRVVPQQNGLEEHPSASRTGECRSRVDSWWDIALLSEDDRRSRAPQRSPRCDSRISIRSALVACQRRSRQSAIQSH